METKQVIFETSQEGIDLIKAFEGFSSQRYDDVAGYPTIGYGHLLSEDDDLSVISEAKAEAFLKADLKASERAVFKYIVHPLTQNQFDALVSFTFNLGAGSLQRSTLRMKLNRGDVFGAADEISKWVYAGGKKYKGLVRRREAERNMFLYGVSK